MGQQTSGLHDPGLHDSEHVTTTLAMEERRPLNISMRGLADDLLLDHILPLLDIRDILNLRRASFQINRLSAEGIVWKRILKRAEHYLPPLPPSAKYAFPNLSAAEAERLLTRAVSLRGQWDQRIVRPLRRWAIDACRTVLEMTLLPGGQYLVASVTDKSRTRFAIDLYTTDFAFRAGFPVARFDVPSKAFHLRAKYLTVRGRPGVAVTYVRRDFRKAHFGRRYGDVNGLPPEWDHPQWRRVLMYECAAVHVPLDALETMCDDVRPLCPVRVRVRAREMDLGAEAEAEAEAARRPFRVLAEITSRSRMSSPVIEDDVQGAPVLAVLKHGPDGDCVVFKNLDGGAGTAMVCTPHPDYQALPHSIMAFSILPPQNQFLIVRRASPDMDPDELAQLQYLGPFYFAELYDIAHAPGTTVTRTAASRSAVHDSRGNYWHAVWLSDPGFGPSLSPLSSDASSSSSSPEPVSMNVSVPAFASEDAVRTYQPDPAKPRPVVIFVSARFSYGVAWDIVPPLPVPSTSTAHARYRYALSEDEAFVTIERVEGGVAEELEREWAMETVGGTVKEERVLLGSTRPLVCTVVRPSPDGSPCGGAGAVLSFRVSMLRGLWDRELLKYEVGDGVDGAAQAGDGTMASDEGHSREGEGEGEEESDMECLPAGDVRVARLDLEEDDLRNVSAVAWDETIGRLCVSYFSRQSDSRIAVFDFAAGASCPAW